MKVKQNTQTNIQIRIEMYNRLIVWKAWLDSRLTLNEYFMIGGADSGTCFRSEYNATY